MFKDSHLRAFGLNKLLCQETIVNKWDSTLSNPDSLTVLIKDTSINYFLLLPHVGNYGDRTSDQRLCVFW